MHSAFAFLSCKYLYVYIITVVWIVVVNSMFASVTRLISQFIKRFTVHYYACAEILPTISLRSHF